MIFRMFDILELFWWGQRWTGTPLGWWRYLHSAVKQPILLTDCHLWPCNHQTDKLIWILTISHRSNILRSWSRSTVADTYNKIYHMYNPGFAVKTFPKYHGVISSLNSEWVEICVLLWSYPWCSRMFCVLTTRYKLSNWTLPKPH